MKSAEELFKYRTGLEKAVPQRGGTKDYMPDGSWLQEKRLEKFHQEREAVLSEPRVQRIADLVKGEWNPDKELVELEKEMRNFWEHMGFVDRKRKWLFPEEALFLMETNVLEVWYQGIPLSIQQGYAMFTSSKFPMEHYQVYSHLRRIGYVVLRHQQRLTTTKYEREIGLDKYISKKERKRRIKNEKEMVKSGIDSHSHSPSKKKNLESCSDCPKIPNKEPEVEISEIGEPLPADESMEFELTKDEMENKSVPQSREYDICEKDVETKQDYQNTNCEVKDEVNLEFKLDKKHETCHLTENEQSLNEQGGKGRFEDIQDRPTIQDTPGRFKDVRGSYIDEIAGKNNKADVSRQDAVHIDNESFASFGLSKLLSTLNEWKIKKSEQTLNRTEWNFDEIDFPDFSLGLNRVRTVELKRPAKRLLPGNFELVHDSYSFDCKEMLNKKKSSHYLNEEPSLFDDSLEFSYPEYLTGHRKVKKSCRNWQEYKMQQWKAYDSWDRSHDFPHLYGDKIGPLVLPEDTTCTGAILDKLHIIQEEQSSYSSFVPEKTPTFDIYAPNIKFKKSAPGIPDHRVFVARRCDPFPNLLQVTMVTQKFQDDVPLLWAVVDNGDIAFYEVADLLLPVDITMG